MKILILGAGSIGGYLASRLCSINCDITILVRENRIKELNEKGIKLLSKLGDAQVNPRFITTDSEAVNFDLVIISCKSHDLNSAIKSIKPHVRKETIIIPFLNGVAHLESLDKEFGRSSVAGGVAHLAVTQVRTGVIQHLNDTHKFTVGSRDKKQLSTLEGLSNACAKANLDFFLSNDIEQGMWDKYIFISTLAGATSTMRASIGTILECSYGKHFILSLLNESISVAKAISQEPNEQQITSYKNELTKKGSTLTASMLRDILSDSKIEGQHIIGDMINKGESLGLELPCMKIAFTYLQSYEINRIALNA